MSLSLPALYLSPLTYFVYHLFSHSASISLSLSSLFLVGFLLLSFFTCLLLHSTYSFLYLFGYMRFIIILLYFFSCIFYLSFFLSAFSAYFSTFFFLFCFSYFVLFSTLFNYLVLILDFNYCNFSLIFIISINICYVFPFSLVVFFTKCELLSFFSFQHMLCGVF